MPLNCQAHLIIFFLVLLGKHFIGLPQICNSRLVKLSGRKVNLLKLRSNCCKLIKFPILLGITVK
jgi:hypothetical protein